MNLPSPIIHEISFSKSEIANLEKTLADEKKKFLVTYPTVYVVNDRPSEKYHVYIGETTDIKRRTIEHLSSDPTVREDWLAFEQSETSKMFIVGHEHFNKSMTLDIENKLMHYMSSVPSVEKVTNRRTNQQSDYYTANEMEAIFTKIWRKLRQRNKELFPLEHVIRDSALFKASPFHKLTDEQMVARERIIQRIEVALNRKKENQLILVDGEAGSGKTVLMSSLLYELNQLAQADSENAILRGATHYLLVNHDQQLTVYQQLAKKLGIRNGRKFDVVNKPTHFITNHTENEKADIVIIDEAHLLWTQGKQSYRGKNQLEDILKRARVVVAVFDKHQILSREQYVDEEQLDTLIHKANLDGGYIKLKNQLRINAGEETVNWIRNLIDKQEVGPIPHDDNYDLQIMKSPEDLQAKIIEKASNEENGISRMLATFDWEYVDKRRPEPADGSSEPKTWDVTIGDWHAPWNLQIEPTKDQKKANRGKAWAEQAQTIGEVGSTFTIQGFDLNYAGVIIGPSVVYRDGKIQFVREASKNKKATQQRTLKDGSKKVLSDELLRNELNVLLTRGVNGLYVYAVDEELRNMLMKMVAKS